MPGTPGLVTSRLEQAPLFYINLLYKYYFLRLRGGKGEVVKPTIQLIGIMLYTCFLLYLVFEKEINLVSFCSAPCNVEHLEYISKQKRYVFHRACSQEDEQLEGNRVSRFSYNLK